MDLMIQEWRGRQVDGRTRLSVPMENEDHIHISIVSWSRVERSVRAM